MKYYAKIYCEEGVITEVEFSSKEEASAYVKGFYDCKDAIDSEDDFHSACVDTEPSKEESPNAD